MGRGGGEAKTVAEGQFAGVFGTRRGHHRKRRDGGTSPWVGSIEQQKYLMSQFGPNWLDVSGFLEGLSQEKLARVHEAHLDAAEVPHESIRSKLARRER